MNYKNNISILSVIIILLCGCHPDKKTTFTAASYNLRTANSADSLQGDGWGNRCPIIARLVQFHEFDIFGTQEGLRHQLDSLKTSLPKYDYIGVGRNDGKKKGEHAAIFYRIDKFELLEHGDFWLSETPEKPSVGWDAVLPRICTWGHLIYKVTTKKRNAERYSDRIELQGFWLKWRKFVKPLQSLPKPNPDAATLLVRNHAR